LTDIPKTLKIDCRQDNIVNFLLSGIYHPHIDIRNFPSSFLHLHFSNLILSSAFYHPHFSICRLHPPSSDLSSVCRHPVFVSQKVTHDSRHAFDFHVILSQQ